MKCSLVILTLLPLCTIAQKKTDSYTAANGITYHEGDTIHAGRGSMPDGSFKYIQIGGFGAALNHNNNANLPKRFSGFNFIVKNIRNYNIKGGTHVEFSLVNGSLSVFNLYVDDAIATCEITPCAGSNANAPASDDKFDQLKKLKALLDSGAITQQEYDEQKKKLLGEGN